MPTDFGATEVSLVTVTPLGASCQANCHAQCTDTFSYKNVYGEMSNDQIQACIMSCQSGVSYSAPTKQASSIAPFWVSSSSNGVVGGCSMNASTALDGNYGFVNTNISLNAGQTFMISADESKTRDNNVYLCGSKSVYLYPGSSSNTYPVSYDDNYTASIKYVMPTQTYTTSCASSTPDPYYCSYNTGNWSPWNKSWTVTNLAPHDGDYLAVYYMGNYYLSSGDSLPSGNILIRPTTMSLNDWGDAIINYTEATNGNYIFPGSSMGVCSTNDYATFQSCVSSSMNTTYTPFALQGNKASGSLPRSATVDNQNAFSMYAFLGNLRNFSSTATMLGLSHYNTSAGTNVYTDNHSGFIVRADWQGCVFKNGTRLQYVIQPTGTVPTSTTTWTDVYVSAAVDATSTATISEIPISANSSGTLFLRIKPLADSEVLSFAPSCNPINSANKIDMCQQAKDTYYKFFGSSTTSGTTTYTSLPKYSGGQYNLAVTKRIAPPNSVISSGLDNIVTGISDSLFGRPGSSSSQGQVQTIFSNMIINSDLLGGIRAALVFFVAYTALSFMLGTSQLNQREAVIVLLKIGIISTLISSESWNFFNTYLFGFIKNGTAEIISDIVSSSTVAADGSTTIFNFLDQPLAQLFSTQVWIKILALAISGLTGWVIAIFIIIASIVFIVVIFKTAMIYITSLVMMAILSIVAPIFLCFILFKYTYEMFSGWLKMYISFALQPIFVIAMVSMMSSVIVFAFQNSLSFTACPLCIFGIGVGKLYTCYLPWVITLQGLTVSGPGALSAPIEAIQSVMLFYLLTQSTNALCAHMCQLASTIATGSAMAMNLASAGVFNPVSSGINHFNVMIGMDSQSRAGRAALGRLGSRVANSFKPRGRIADEGAPSGGGGTSSGDGGAPTGGGGTSSGDGGAPTGGDRVSPGGGGAPTVGGGAS